MKIAHRIDAPSLNDSKAIIWDADGVLFKTFDESGNFRWSANIEKDLGVGENILNDIFSGEWKDVLVGKRHTRDHIAAALNKHAAAPSADEFISYWLEHDLILNREVLDLIEPEISYIGTNQDPLRTELIEKIFAGKVVKIFSSSTIGFMKPHKEFYTFIENDLGLTPAQITLIDDTKENVESAISMGWNAVLYNVCSIN